MNSISISAIATTTTIPIVPQLVTAIPDVVVQFGVYFEFEVPVTTFYDYQDGWTDSLTLTARDHLNQVRH